MSNEILLLKPIFKERIWGGNKLNTLFDYEIPSSKTGECWAISSHKEGSSIIANGPYQGKTLRWVYENDKSLFGNITLKEFPLLTKIIDADADLSVQVHPNDEQAKRYGDLGKTECWYVIDCLPGSSIVYGHHAKTNEQLADYIAHDRWEELLGSKPIKPGDFIYVPAGKIHAIPKGCLILETQQSSDITFRLYDYGRRDQNGKLRELHIEDAKLATTVPDEEVEVQPTVQSDGRNSIHNLIRSDFFNVEKWEVKDEYTRENRSFFLVSVLNGSGQVNRLSIHKGSHFIVTSKTKVLQITGNLECIVAYLD